MEPIDRKNELWGVLCQLELTLAKLGFLPTLPPVWWGNQMEIYIKEYGKYKDIRN